MINSLKYEDFSTFLSALRFAAGKHADQRRKGSQHPPYINHPIEVAVILWTSGGVRDIVLLTAALLHDTVEDTATSPVELREKFGEEVTALVLEVTDDKSLPKEVRKQLQIETAPKKSKKAKQLKLADKISNITEISSDPPEDWTHERRVDYLDWASKVAAGLRGVNPALEARFDQVLAEGQERLLARSGQ